MSKNLNNSTTASGIPYACYRDVDFFDGQGRCVTEREFFALNEHGSRVEVREPRRYYAKATIQMHRGDTKWSEPVAICLRSVTLPGAFLEWDESVAAIQTHADKENTIVDTTPAIAGESGIIVPK